MPALYFYLLYIARDEIIKTKPELLTLEVLLPEDSTERQRSIREAHAALDTRASALGDLQFLRHTTGSPVLVQISVTKHSFAAVVARQLGFLHGAYERQYYYWEVIETTRRLLLTAVVSVVGTGTSLQVHCVALRCVTLPDVRKHTHILPSASGYCRLSSAFSSRCCS